MDDNHDKEPKPRIARFSTPATRLVWRLFAKHRNVQRVVNDLKSCGYQTSRSSVYNILNDDRARWASLVEECQNEAYERYQAHEEATHELLSVSLAQMSAAMREAELAAMEGRATRIIDPKTGRFVPAPDLIDVLTRPHMLKTLFEIAAGSRREQEAIKPRSEMAELVARSVQDLGRASIETLAAKLTAAGADLPTGLRLELERRGLGGELAQAPPSMPPAGPAPDAAPRPQAPVAPQTTPDPGPPPTIQKDGTMRFGGA